MNFISILNCILCLSFSFLFFVADKPFTFRTAIFHRMALSVPLMNSWAEVCQDLNSKSYQPLRSGYPNRLRPADCPELTALSAMGVRVANFRFESRPCHISAWDEVVGALPGRYAHDSTIVLRPSGDRNRETIIFPTVIPMARVMGWLGSNGALPARILGHGCRPGEVPEGIEGHGCHSGEAEEERCFSVLGAVARESPTALGILPARSWNGVPCIPRGFLPIPADNLPVMCLGVSHYGCLTPIAGARKFHYLDATRSNYHGAEFDSFALQWRRSWNQKGTITLQVPCALLGGEFNFSAVENYLANYLPYGKE